jgi:N-acetylmuramoyl-L-alanine amidase
MFGKVVFDPGHGAKINAGPTGYYEGDTMLKLGMMLKARGYTLTKEDGTDTDLLARVKRAKALGANTLISLHTDWVPPDKPTQTEKITG